MGLKSVSSRIKQQKGFTIVELLIVVVVIAVLAAITIVSYNGITNRANASAALATAASLQKKVELFAADGPTGTYPRALADLTGTAAILTASPTQTTVASNSWYITPGTMSVGTPSSSNGKTTLIYTVCGNNGTSTTAPTTIAGMTAISGVSIQYFDYNAGTGTQTITMGNATTSSGASARGCVAAAS